MLAPRVFDPYVQWIVIILLLLTTTAYLGRWHKYFELTSHFRVQYAIASVGCLLICVTVADWWCAAGALLGVAINSATIAPFYKARTSLANGAVDSLPLKLLLINVNVHRLKKARRRLVACIERHQPDVVIVQEINQEWASALQGLVQQYPFFEVLPRNDGSGIALYSRHSCEHLPLALPEGDARPGLLVKLDVNGVSVCLLSIHPRAPIRRGHFELRNQMLASATAYLQDLPGPKICVGDLNASPWSPFFQDLAQQTNLISVRQGFGVLPSWPTFMGPKWLMIPIDHCLVSRDIRVVSARTGERIGSDHLPLIVESEIQQPRASRT